MHKALQSRAAGFERIEKGLHPDGLIQEHIESFHFLASAIMLLAKDRDSWKSQTASTD